MILDNRGKTIREVAANVGILFSLCQIRHYKPSVRIIDLAFHTAQEMLATFKDDPDLLIKVITGDESWVYGYDIKTKAQPS